MARRQLWQPPSGKAQERAFHNKTGGDSWRGIRISDHLPTLHEGLRYFLELELAATGEEERRREGRPAKLKRALRAVEELDRYGIAVSDAPGSQCVNFLMRWGPMAKGTAEQLAGSLVAYEKQMLLTYSLRE